jgi:hypothetical protein
MSKKKTEKGPKGFDLASPFAVQLYSEDMDKVEAHATNNRHSKGRSVREAVRFAHEKGFGK